MTHPIIPKELTEFSIVICIMLLWIAVLFVKIERDEIEEILWTLGFGLVYPFFWLIVVLPPAIPYWTVFIVLAHASPVALLPLIASGIGGMVSFIPLFTWIYILHRKTPKQHRPVKA